MAREERDIKGIDSPPSPGSSIVCYVRILRFLSSRVMKLLLAASRPARSDHGRVVRDLAAKRGSERGKRTERNNFRSEAAPLSVSVSTIRPEIVRTF